MVLQETTKKSCGNFATNTKGPNGFIHVHQRQTYVAQEIALLPQGWSNELTSHVPGTYFGVTP